MEGGDKLICSKCGEKIPPGTRYVIGDRGGTYHVSCGSELKSKAYGYTKGKKKPYRYVR